MIVKTRKWDRDDYYGKLQTRKKYISSKNVLVIQAVVREYRDRLSLAEA